MKHALKPLIMVLTIASLLSVLNSCGPNQDELKQIVMDYRFPSRDPAYNFPFGDLIESSMSNVTWTYGSQEGYSTVILDAEVQIGISSSKYQERIMFVIHPEKKTVDYVIFPLVKNFEKDPELAIGVRYTKILSTHLDKLKQ